MDTDLREEMSMLRAAMEELRGEFKKRFASEDEDTIDMSAYERDDDDKETMEADDMIQQQFAEEGKDIHIDIDSHEGAPDEIEIETDEDEDDVMFPASRQGHADVFAMRRQNAQMARELKALRNELKHEKFSRELDTMESEGYRIPADRRSALIGELIASRDPAQLIDTWRELFARDPMGVRIDMSRAQLPTSDIDHRDVSDLVREFAGKPEEFRKAVNSRMKKR